MDGSTTRTPSPSTYLLRSIEREHGFVPLETSGVIPDELEGTLYRVGPGLMDSVGVKITHLFEADGAISAVRFRGGRAEGAVRVVDSQGLRDERAAGVPLYGPRASYPRRILSALRGRSKNTANTAPMLFQNRLFAMMEAALPTEIDPETLRTIGETDFGGVIPHSFSAHPHRVEARRASYNFGIRYGRFTVLDLFELPDDGPVLRISSIPLERPVMMHDFIATTAHLVFFVDPFEVVVPRAIFQVGGFADMFEWRASRGSEIIVVPIDAPERATRFRVPAFYQWHFGNAFEDGDSILVDFVRYADADSFHRIGDDVPLGGDLVRVRVSPRRATIDIVGSTGGMSEFPRIDPRHGGSRHRYVFTTAESATTRGIARTDLETGERSVFVDGTHTWYAEPVFIPTPSAPEGVGHVVSAVLDARSARTHIAIFDSTRVSDGPIGRASFDGPRPITFHGMFVPANG